MAFPKPSSSLIIAKLVEQPALNHGFDYKILHLRRAKGMNWGGALAYPGGSVDKSDRFHFQRLGKKHNTLERTPLQLEYDLAKLAALRETFEETGLFFLTKTAG